MEEIRELIEEAEKLRGTPVWTDAHEEQYQLLLSQLGDGDEEVPVKDQEVIEELPAILDNKGAAFVIGVLDGLSPVGAKWALEKAGMDVDTIEDRYPGAMNSGEWAGLVVGLANVPGLVARLAKVAGKRAIRPASGGWKLGRGKNVLIAMRKKATDIAKNNVSLAVAKRAEADKRLIDDILTDIDTKLTTRDVPYSTDEIIKNVRAKLHSAPDGSILKDQADIFAGWFSKELTRTDIKVGGSGIFSKLKNDFINNLIRASKLPNAIQIGLDEVIFVSSDFALNYSYAYTDAIEQGKSVSEAKDIAWAFSTTKTPIDVMADITGNLGVVGKLVGNATKFGIAVSDVESDATIKDPRKDKGLIAYQTEDPDADDYVVQMRSGGLIAMGRP